MSFWKFICGLAIFDWLFGNNGNRPKHEQSIYDRNVPDDDPGTGYTAPYHHSCLCDDNHFDSYRHYGYTDNDFDDDISSDMYDDDF